MRRTIYRLCLHTEVDEKIEDLTDRMSFKDKGVKKEGSADDLDVGKVPKFRKRRFGGQERKKQPAALDLKGITDDKVAKGFLGPQASRCGGGGGCHGRGSGKGQRHHEHGHGFGANYDLGGARGGHFPRGNGRRHGTGR